jgi:hypothetical protein
LATGTLFVGINARRYTAIGTLIPINTARRELSMSRADSDIGVTEEAGATEAPRCVGLRHAQIIALF